MGRYHIETSPLICTANQWADVYMITASVMRVNQRCEHDLRKVIEILVKLLLSFFIIFNIINLLVILSQYIFEVLIFVLGVSGAAV